jgi:hypothetical protein
MLDECTLRRKVVLRLLGSPYTVGPFMAGMTALTASWALGWNQAIGIFAGLAGTLAACGTFLTRLLLSGDRVAQKVSSEMALTEKRAKQQTLDALDQRLATADNDPRPETALRDLRALLQVFEETGSSTAGLNTTSVFEVQSTVSRIFDQCVYALQQTDKLWQTARQLKTPQARAPILEQRERLIADVQSSIKQLSDALAAVQTLGTEGRSGVELQRIREELDQSLAVAKTVEERMNSFIKELDVKAQTQAVQVQQQQKG